jgi:hypothetical protein
VVSEIPKGDEADEAGLLTCFVKRLLYLDGRRKIGTRARRLNERHGEARRKWRCDLNRFH